MSCIFVSSRSTVTSLPLGTFGAGKWRLATLPRNPAEGEHTAATWATEWTSGRATRNKQADLRRVEMHFCSFSDFGKRKLTDFRPQQFRDWAKHGRELVDAGKMGAKTFRNVYGVLHTMFHDAVVTEKIAINPCVLSRSDLPAQRAKKGRRYEDEESRELVWSPALPVDVRMLFCLLSYTGERDVANEGPHSLYEIADILGVSAERVRQIEEQAIAHLKENTVLRRLNDELSE